MLIGVVLPIQAAGMTFGGSVWLGITTVRMLRKVSPRAINYHFGHAHFNFFYLVQIWQCTADALLELAVVSILHLSLPPDSSWIALGWGTQAFIVGLVAVVLDNICKRSAFFLVLLYSFLFDSKQRSRHHCRSVAITLLLLPTSLAAILLSSVVSSPVFPIFTLPILLPSFPRVRSYWPHLLHKETVSQPIEAAVYQQATDKIGGLVFHLMSSGVLRYNVNSETVVLVRFQDRLVMVSLAEKGYTYCNVCLRGLEMQETSCHTVEASQIDDAFEVAHTINSCTLPFWFNTYPLHLLVPLTADVLHVYSDARNNLAGIIDQYENLKGFSDNLLKLLVWEFARSVKESPSPMQTEGSAPPPNQSPGPAKKEPPLPHPARRQSALSADSSDSWIESSDDENPSQFRPVFLAAKGFDNSDGSLQVKSVVRQVATCHHGTPNPITQASSKARIALSAKTKSAIVSPAKFNGFDVTVPFSDSQLDHILASFPYHWLTSVSNRLSLDSLAVEQVKKLAAACFLVMDCSANKRATNQTTPGHLLRGFSGKFPSLNSDQQWLRNSGAFPLAQRAYRQGCHLRLSQSAQNVMCVVNGSLYLFH